VGFANEALEETERAQEYHVARKRFECPSSAKRKRPRTWIAESGQVSARTNQRCREEEDQKPSLVTSCVPVRTVSDPDEPDEPDQQVVQEEATPDEIPVGWTRTKLEPDW
jgi:hypothetical protein